MYNYLVNKCLGQEYTIYLINYDFRITEYLILHDDRKNHIWYPKIMYIDSINVEKKKGFGPGFENPQEFKMFPDHRIQLSENLKVTFSCEFDFSTYPFDKHECNLAFYDREYVDTILLNQVEKIGKKMKSFISISGC